MVLLHVGVSLVTSQCRLDEPASVKSLLSISLSVSGIVPTSCVRFFGLLAGDSRDFACTAWACTAAGRPQHRAEICCSRCARCRGFRREVPELCKELSALGLAGGVLLGVELKLHRVILVVNTSRNKNSSDTKKPALAGSGFGFRRGRAALRSAQRRGRVVVSSVQSREGSSGRNEKPRGAGLVLVSAS